MAEGKKTMYAKKRETNEVPGKEYDAVKGKRSHALCQPCSKTEKRNVAVIFCLTCDEFQCLECSQIHKVYAFMKNHQLVAAKEAEFKPKPIDMEGLDQCFKHRKPVEFFCEDERMLCCNTCAIVDHRRCHSVVEIESIAGKSRTTGSESKVQLREVKERADKVVKFTKSAREQLNQDLKRIPLKMKQMRADMNKMFGDLVVQATKSSNTFVTETIDNITTKQAVCENLLSEITHFLAIIENVCKHGTDAQKFIIELKLKPQLSELQHKTREILSQGIENPEVSFEFFSEINLPPKPISDYIPGILTLKYRMPTTMKNTGVENPIKKLEKITSIDLKQTGDDTKQPLYAGLDFLPDGRLVVIDNKNKIFLIFNENVEKVGSYKLSYPPQDVVAVSEEKVAITSCRYKIELLHVTKSNDISLIRTCKVTKMYTSICMKDDENFVVGTCDDTIPVRILSLSGEENIFCTSFPQKKYFLSSECTYIRNSAKVVLTDQEEHTVYIYDLSTNTRIVVKDDQIKEPRGVVRGPSDCILICSEDTNSIVQITQTGRIVSSHVLDMERPACACISQDEQIVAVASRAKEKMKLLLFKLLY